MKPMLVYFNI